MEHNYVVYKHTNLINGKSYIGITNNLNIRWAGSGSRYKSYNSIFGRAIDKYGWDGFSHEVLESGLTRSEAVELEKYYIAHFRTNIYRHGNAFGYNMTDGGDGICGAIYSDDTKKKISDALSSPNCETRKRMSDASKGRQTFLGCTLSDEHKKKLSHGRDIANAKRGKPVYCVETNSVYKSSEDASHHLNISASSISSVCRGVRDSVKEHHFRYATECECVAAGVNLPQQVMCVDTGEVFHSPVDAAKYINVPTSYITRCCVDSNRSTRGLRWKYIT